ncbi:MAG: PHB depolymerase family esterase [Acidimicrobiales bacterium]
MAHRTRPIHPFATTGLLVPLVALVVLVALAVACSPAPAGDARMPTTASIASGCDRHAGQVPTRGAQERIGISSGGRQRWYLRFVPSTYDGSPVPLVINLHGYLSGAAGAAAISGLDGLAERERFVLATPEGNSDKPYWNAVPHAELPDDVGFIAGVIDEVTSAVCVDPERVYVVGFSNGAFLASLVACRLADRVAAIAAVAGLQDPADCRPTSPVSVLAIHGTDDGYVPITGGAGPRLASLEWSDESRTAFDGLPWSEPAAAAAAWAARARCRPDPERMPVAASVERITYVACEGNASVELYVIAGAGHTWPGSELAAASAAVLGPATSAIDANEVIWSFFADHPRGAHRTGGEP